MMLLPFLMTTRQQKILSLFLFYPETSFSLSDFLKTVGPGHGATQRYLKQLVAESVVVVDNELPQPRYIVNNEHSLYSELYALLGKAAVTK